MGVMMNMASSGEAEKNVSVPIVPETDEGAKNATTSTVVVEEAPPTADKEEDLDSGDNQAGASVSLQDLLQTNDFLVPGNPELRKEIEACVVELERENPVKEKMVDSDLLEGSWEIAFTSQTKGGMLGLQVLAWISSQSRGIFNLKEVQLGISKNKSSRRPEQEWNGEWIVEAKVKVSLLTGEEDVVVTTVLKPTGDKTLSETYISVEAAFLRLPLPRLLPPPLQRSIELTYLDEDILVSRDGTGVDILLKNEFSM